MSGKRAASWVGLILVGTWLELRHIQVPRLGRASHVESDLVAGRPPARADVSGERCRGDSESLASDLAGQDRIGYTWAAALRLGLVRSL